MSNIYANNINPRSGDTVTFPQNIKVLGTATYEDVANVDSVGIITAQSGVNVTGGTVTVGSDPNDGVNAGTKLTTTGVVQATRSSGGSAVFMGYTQNNSVPRVRINGNGSSYFLGEVGIGTNSITSFTPTLQVAGADPCLLLEDNATSVDYFGVNIGSGVVNAWYDDASALVIHTAAGISGSGLAEKLRLTKDGKLIISNTQRTTPHGAQGDGAMFVEQTYDGNLYGLMLRNKDTGANAATSLGFSLNRSGGDQDFEAGQIKLEKEQSWTTSSATVDGAMVFSTISNGSLGERLRIDSSGRLLVGTSSAPTDTSNGAYYSKLVSVGNMAGASGDGRLALCRGNTAANLSNGNGIGEIHFADSAGGGFAYIAVQADGTPGANDYPGRLLFATTADGASSPTERMRISESGLLSTYGGHKANGGGSGLGSGSYNRFSFAGNIAASSSTTFTFSGLSSGWMTIRGGGYASAGQEAFGVMYHLGGLMTATYTYDIVTLQNYIRSGSISTTKNGANFQVTITNGSASYTCGYNFTVEGNGTIAASAA